MTDRHGFFLEDYKTSLERQQCVVCTEFQGQKKKCVEFKAGVDVYWNAQQSLRHVKDAWDSLYTSQSGASSQF